MSSYNNHRIFALALLACIVIIFFVLFSCNPVDPTCPYPYHIPVDSAFKVIENLEYSYILQDMQMYMQSFRSDFVFYYISNGDTLNWGYNTEENIHYPSMFRNAYMIELTLVGSEEYPWSGDTTGSTLVLPREYDLKVYMVPDSAEYWALGTADFICRQDSMEEWYVWQWWDFPDAGKDGWGDIKESFMTPPSTH